MIADDHGCAPALDGRDSRRVPANWEELLDPQEWQLNHEGLPARDAARVIVLRREPEPAILLVQGHDFSDAAHSWAFTPGGGLLAGESHRDGACRELAEETGLQLGVSELAGPVLQRSSRFEFNLVTCRQHELYFLAILEDSAVAKADQLLDADGELDRTGWTEMEREVLDSLRWWSFQELDEAVAAGLTVYPHTLPSLARQLLAGWDGVLRSLREED
ncbi:NUDIX domain [Actinomyces bovis]|uniref:NUDIX domain n=1 Tax=Actinomyces bovis TaxID=1658 RepID=A0ABY1VQZ3_9ACTO|nr:NUDIX domain-containing protein [Actinomyces bovis]SPT54092.1 NUDIX domain [Actinomyces bovis]VEG53691.1 NUDIX domain [Actinomyces israelii]